VNVSYLQAIIATVTFLSFLGGTCAFLFVIWPSIRNAERRGARLEAWMESDDAKKLVSALKSKIGLEEGGAQSTREAFMGEERSKGESGKI
jgi:hypothetical protein